MSMAEGSHLITRDQDKQRSWPSAAFKIRYRKIRERLGLSPLRKSFPRLSRHTHLTWKFDSFERNAEWIWTIYLEHTEHNPTANRAIVMINLVGKTFGIALKDLRGPCRDQAVSIPRMLGMALLRKDGVGYPHIRKAFHKDPKSAAHAFVQMKKYTEQLGERISDRGHPSIGEPARRVQAHVSEVVEEDGPDDEAGPDCDTGRSD